METDEQIGVGDIVTIPEEPLDVKYVVSSVDNDCVELVHDSYIGTPFWIPKKYVRLAR